MQDRERSAAIATYLRGLYGDIDAARINVENFNYFWDSAPSRDTFVATWKCARSHTFVDSCGTQYQAPLYGALCCCLFVGACCSRRRPKRARLHDDVELTSSRDGASDDVKHLATIPEERSGRSENDHL